MMKLLLAFFIGIFATTTLYGQALSLSGTVRDAKGLSIPGAGIYISGTKMATVSDADGKFIFKPINAGSYDLLVQMIGFNPQKTHVSVLDKNEKIEITLIESTTSIGEVVIKPDPNRSFYLQQFKDNFIGRTPNAMNCTILNPEVIQFDFDKETRVLTASATDFLIIENKALGYRIKYLLSLFTSDASTRIVYYEGYPSFEEMIGNKRNQKKWLNARRVAYYGSSQHFYRSLFTGTSTADGFYIYKISHIKNMNRPDDSIIESHLKTLMKAKVSQQGTLTINSNDSLSYWMKKKNEPKSLAVFNQSVVNPDTLVHSYNENLKYLYFDNEMFVLYTKEKESESYSNTGYWLTRPLTIADGQASQIRALKLPIGFYLSGSVADPTSTLSLGYFAYEKIADQVPLEYHPN